MASMLSVVLKNLVNKSPTRPYPFKERPAFERSRGRIVFDETNCIYCSLCARKCPADAITVDRNDKSWELNVFRCVICGECVTACAVKKCITMTNERRHPKLAKTHLKFKKAV